MRRPVSPPRAKPTAERRAGRQAAPPAGLKLVLPASCIARRVRELGRRVSRALTPRERPVAVVVLQGAKVFAADLLGELPAHLKLEVAFVRCQSYGAGTRSSGRVALLQDLAPSLDLRGRTVLLIEDIMDSGLTLRFLARRLRERGARRVRICVLLRRRGRRPPQAPRADFVGFEVGSEFFVGYGLDLAGRCRHLPFIAAWHDPPAKRDTRPRQIRPRCDGGAGARA